MVENTLNKWKIDFWSLFFSVLSLILFELTLFVPPEQKLITSGFLIISIIFAVILYYINKINYNELMLAKLNKTLNKFGEKVNYLKELYDLKLRVTMLERKKRGQINIMDLIKILVAIILIYVIISVARSLF